MLSNQVGDCTSDGRREAGKLKLMSVEKELQRFRNRYRDPRVRPYQEGAKFGNSRMSASAGGVGSGKAEYEKKGTILKEVSINFRARRSGLVARRHGKTMEKRRRDGERSLLLPTAPVAEKL